MLTAHRRLTPARGTAPLLSAIGFAFLVASVLLPLPPFHSTALAAQISIEWDANAEPDLSGYRVYYGTSSGQYTASVDVGNNTRCVISSLAPGVTYYFAATAYDTEGNESGFSDEIVYAVPAAAPGPGSSSSVGGSGGGGGCFIATAAYGSYMAPEVTILRRFRDDVLLASAPGTAFVRLYYRVSPPIADRIRDHEHLRSITRWFLTPVVYGVKYPGTSGVILLLALTIGFGVRMRKDRHREGSPGYDGALYTTPRTDSDLRPRGE